MVYDTPKFGMRIKANRPGFYFGSERAIPFMFEHDILPEVIEQQDIRDFNGQQDTIERQVFNQPSFGQDRFMAPFQVISETNRLRRQSKRDMQRAQRDIDVIVPEHKLQKRRRDIIGKIW